MSTSSAPAALWFGGREIELAGTKGRDISSPQIIPPITLPSQVITREKFVVNGREGEVMAL